METTKIAVKVEEKNAVLAGSKVHGWIVIEYDPATLTEAQRQTVVSLPTEQLKYLGFGPDGRGELIVARTTKGIATADNLPEILDEIFILREKEKADKLAREAQEKSDAIARHEKTIEMILGKTDEWLADNITRSGGTTGDLAYYKSYYIHSVSSAICNDPRLYEKLDRAIEIKLARAARVASADVLREKEKAAKDAEKAAKEERKQLQLTAWVSEHMSEIQQKRFAAKLLGEKEIIDSIRDHIFAPLNDEPRYEKITSSEVRDAADLDYYDAGTVEFYLPDVESVTDEQFERMEFLKSKIPGATVEVRNHAGYIDGVGNNEDRVTRLSILVTKTVGELTLSREYAL